MSPTTLNDRSHIGALLAILVVSAAVLWKSHACTALARWCGKYVKLLGWVAPPAALLTDTHSVVEFLAMLKDHLPLG